MICPSCQHQNEDAVRYCTRCRMAFSKTNLSFARARDHFFWVLRRANAGFVSGMIAWFFIPVVSRIMTYDGRELFMYILTGLMGGAFLGSVDGMVEESSPKTIRGAWVGGLGGAIGGFVFFYLKTYVPMEHILWSLFIYWAIVGAFIGTVSAFWERQQKKLIAGMVSGFVGGGIGGYLGSAVHANLVQQFDPQTWIVQRLLEALIGGLIGLSLWFSIGMAERLFIFNRRLVKNKDFKQCDNCENKNPLSSWYCGTCGSVLQVSVPSTRLNLPPYHTLTRVSEMFRFLSRLAASTGFIAGFVSLFIFLPGDPFAILGALVIIALLSYTFQVVFSGISEGLQILIKK